jgi:hypothetical protein
MPKTRPANPGQLRVRIKWYVSRQSNFSALSLTNSNCPYRTRMWRGLLLITDQIEEACDNAPFSARFHTTRCACGEARYLLPQTNGGLYRRSPSWGQSGLPREIEIKKSTCRPPFQRASDSYPSNSARVYHSSLLRHNNWICYESGACFRYLKKSQARHQEGC